MGPDANPFSASMDAVVETMMLNFREGMALPMQVFGPKMVEGLEGDDGNSISIIGTSSMAAIDPLSRVGAYGAAKAALANYAKGMAGELGRRFGEPCAS